MTAIFTNIYNQDFTAGVVPISTASGVCSITDTNSHQGVGITGPMCLQISTTSSAVYSLLDWPSAPISYVSLNDVSAHQKSIYKIDILQPFYYDFMTMGTALGTALDIGDKQNGYMIELYTPPATMGDTYLGGCGPNGGAPLIRVNSLAGGVITNVLSAEYPYSVDRPGIMFRIYYNNNTTDKAIIDAENTIDPNVISFWTQSFSYADPTSPVATNLAGPIYSCTASNILGSPTNIRIIPSYYRYSAVSNYPASTSSTGMPNSYGWIDYMHMSELVFAGEPLVNCNLDPVQADFSSNHFVCLPTQYTSVNGGRVFTVPYIYSTPGFLNRLRISAPSSSF